MLSFLFVSPDVGSRIVPGSDWYDRYNDAAYTKNFISNAGDQIGNWTFELTVEPSDQCPELAGWSMTEEIRRQPLKYVE